MAGLEIIGVESVFLTTAFSKGLSTYLGGLKSAEKQTKTVTSSISGIGSSVTGPLSSAMTAAGSLVGSFVGIVATASAAVVGLGAAMAGLALGAAPIEGVEIAFRNMSETAGVSLAELRAASKGTISDLQLMRNANLALVGTAGEFRSAFAGALPDLLEAARAAAKATGQDPAFLFESLVTGIKRASPRLIDNTGIVLKLGAANDAMAESLGKTTGELTDEETQIAILNATLAASKDLISSVGSGQLTLSTAVSQVKASFQNTGVAVGRFFLPGMTSIVSAINRVVVAFGEAVSEGGSLYPLMVNLGAALSIVGDAFQSLAGVVERALGGMSSDWVDKLGQMVSDAFQWGSDLIIQFAEGMVAAASGAIDAAANWINSLLSSWFAPGSPPKILPEIDSWGASTMNEYLKGFEAADYSILNSVQSSLKTVFGLFTEQGRMTRAEAEHTWAGVSEEIVKGLESGDFSGAFQSIQQTAGEYGSQLVQLVKDEQALSQATRQLQKAEQDLENSRKRSSALEGKRAKLLQEYNDLARKGASPEVLAAKLAEINATENSLQASYQETAQAEEAVSLAKEREDALKGQVQMTQELIKTLVELAQAQAATDKETGGKKAKPEGGGMGAGGGLEIDTEGMAATIQEKISAAIDQAKQRIKDKFAQMWMDIKDFVSVQAGNIWTGIQEKWGVLTTWASETWTNVKTTFTTKLQEIKDSLVGEGTFLGDWWKEHGENMKTVVGEAWDWIVARYDEKAAEYEERQKARAEFLKGIWAAYSTDVKERWNKIVEFWTAHGDEVKRIAERTWTQIKDTFKAKLEGIGDAFDVWAAIFKGDWKQAWVELKEGWADQWELFRKGLVTAFENLKDLGTILFDAGAALLQGMIDGINSKITAVVSAITKAAGNIPKWVKDLLGIKSPSRVFMEIGKSVMEGFALGIEKNENDPTNAMRQSLRQVMSPAMASQAVTNNTTYSRTVNMGGVVIQNSLGAVELESRIRRALKQGM